MRLIFLFLPFYTNLLYSQYISTYSILQRYWNYRYNLVGDRIDPSYANWPAGMMIVGAGSGHSIPADASYPTPNSGNYFLCTIDNTKGGLKWGDSWWATARYIEVLATEWKLINDNDNTIGDTYKENLTQTETELFYAMQAVERLDSVGQSIFFEVRPNITGLLGFLARDDVPSDFLTNNTLSVIPSVRPPITWNFK